MKGDLCAEDEVITTKEMCETAATSLGLSDTSAVVRPNYESSPSGCYFYGVTLNFNTHPNSRKSNPSAAPICKKGIKLGK